MSETPHSPSPQRGISIEIHDDFPNTHKGDRALWAAVVAQALSDAASQSAKPHNIKAKIEAIEWLKGNSDDFHIVCDHAGLDPAYIKQTAQNIVMKQLQLLRGASATERKALTDKLAAMPFATPLNRHNGATQPSQHIQRTPHRPRPASSAPIETKSAFPQPSWQCATASAMRRLA